MIYHYKDITPFIRRPIIEIVVKTEGRFAIYPVLIDSGADYCIFSVELAKDLEIKLGDKSYETKAIFAEISDFGHGILGQQGFFDHFDVKLSYYKQIVEVVPIKLSN